MVQINRMGSFANTQQMNNNKTGQRQAQTANLAFSGQADKGMKAAKKFPRVRKMFSGIATAAKKVLGGVKNFFVKGFVKAGEFFKGLFKSKKPPTIPQ